MVNKKYTKHNPYLSIVTYCRNDDYADGVVVQKLQYTLDMTLHQLERNTIETEYIIVDWNPPGDRPRLKEILKIPDVLNYVTVKVIEVEPEVHRRYKYWKKRPVHGAVAFNTGIRRALGDFIVVKVADVIWSNELVEYIAQKELSEKILYRCNRIDVKFDINADKKKLLKDLISHCKNNIIVERDFLEQPEDFPKLHTSACGDFQLLSRQVWNDLGGFEETETVASPHVDGLLSFCAYSKGVKEVQLKSNMILYKFMHSSQNNQRVKLKFRLFELLVYKLKLSKSLEIKLIYNYQKIFGEPKVYTNSIPIPSYNDYVNRVRAIINKKASNVLNDNNWGLINEKSLVKEYILN